MAAAVRHPTLSLLLLLAAFLAGAPVSLGQMNVIDRCWRRNPNWSASRQRLAVCSVGFAGKMRRNRGRGLVRYTVTDPTDDPTSPRRGTLRYGATVLRGKVWITFQRDMQIKLQRPLLLKSFTTVDGRGADVHIAEGAGFVLHRVSDVIIHGLQFHHIQSKPAGPVVAPGGKIVNQAAVDGDAIRIVTSSKIWIDHNTLYACEDGLLDVTRGSTDITISNNLFRDHDKVMLLGHDDGYIRDRRMRVTVVFNRFGPNCRQRMPRARHGYVHVVNNLYEGWKDYAIGGTMSPSIKSEANEYIASNSGNKAVTWVGDGRQGMTWRSVNDAFTNGAFFGGTMSKGGVGPGYKRPQTFPVGRANTVRSLTRDAGAFRCSTRSRC